MNLPSSRSLPLPPNPRDTLARLIGNLSGFAYRRKPDDRWTMEYVSAGCRDVTGYDPHRFVGNASLAFGDLVAPDDRRRVDRRIALAALRRQRTTVEYPVRTAHGAWVLVEDRLTPVLDEEGRLLAIEGIVDRVRSANTPRPDEEHLTTARLLWSAQPSRP